MRFMTDTKGGNKLKKVNVILSTYNGEKYLSEQLQSLLNQTYRNITIFIRDDGSTDKTLEIINEYKNKCENGIDICLYEDSEGNIGYVKSFLKAIRNSPKADYYAFCDQDDFWLPNKIELAVNALKKKEKKGNCLIYSSAYCVCDEKLQIMSAGHTPTPMSELSVGKSLSLYDGGWLLGFTLVINNVLKEKAFDNSVEKMYSHDIWVQAVAAGMKGDLIIGEQVSVYFRRHSNTTSIAESNVNQSFVEAWKYRLKELLGNGELFTRLNDGIESYLQVYKANLTSKEDILFAKRFSKSEGWGARFGKLTYPYRLKKKLFVEIAWRFAILLGKI